VPSAVLGKSLFRIRHTHANTVRFTLRNMYCCTNCTVSLQMKSVGEVMAIGRTWQESLQKAPVLSFMHPSDTCKNCKLRCLTCR
jgi:hypothetical protein